MAAARRARSSGGRPAAGHTGVACFPIWRRTRRSGPWPWSPCPRHCRRMMRRRLRGAPRGGGHLRGLHAQRHPFLQVRRQTLHRSALPVGNRLHGRRRVRFVRRLHLGHGLEGRLECLLAALEPVPVERLHLFEHVLLHLHDLLEPGHCRAVQVEKRLCLARQVGDVHLRLILGHMSSPMPAYLHCGKCNTCRRHVGINPRQSASPRLAQL